MHINVKAAHPDWVKVERPEFMKLLSAVNWRKEIVGNIDYYGAHSWADRIAARVDDDDTYWVDPKFFKRADH